MSERLGALRVYREREFWGFYTALLVAVGVYVYSSGAGARVLRQPSSTWQVEVCYTNDCIAKILNSLSSERAAEAKLTTWSNATYVWYRRDGR